MLGRWISNHKLWLSYVFRSKRVVAITSEEEKKNCCVRLAHNCFVNAWKGPSSLPLAI
jgi:hypothetical protein